MRTLRAIGWSIFSSIFIFGASISMAQGPYNFNGDTSTWTVQNSTLTAGDYSIDYDISGGSLNNNRLNLTESIDTATAPSIIAITMMNDTANVSMQFVLNTNATGNNGFGYKRISGVPANQTNFSTLYYDLDNHGKWNGSNVIQQMFLRFKTASSGTGSSGGNVYIDKIEFLSAQPSSSPSMTITSSTSGVTDGSSTGDSSITLVFSSSEVTTDFVESDIQATGCNIENFSGIRNSATGMTYTATCAPDSPGAVTIDVAAGAFSGATSGVNNSAATQFNWTQTSNDTSAPTLATVTAVTTPDNDSTPDFVFSSNEAGTTTSSLSFSSTTSAISGNNTITFSGLSDGVYYNETVTVTDASGNAASLIIPTFYVDTTAPELSSVSLSSNNSTSTLAKAANVVTLTFKADKSLTSTPAVTFTSGGDSTTNADSVINDGGNYTITVPSDKTGNVGGTPANSFVDRSITFVRPPVNSEAPQATWGTATARDTTRVGTNLYFRKFTWSNANAWCESINGRLATGAEVTTHLIPLLGSSSNGFWEAELKWPQQTTHYWTASVAGDDDGSETRHKAFITKNTSSGADVYELQGRANTTTMWPLCVARFERSFTSTYTVASGDTDGAVAYSIAFTDALGNAGTAVTSGSGSVTVDKTGPTVTIASSTVSSGATSNDSSIALTFTSSEATTNLAESDITVSGGSISNFAASSSTIYTATFTASGDGATSVDISAGKFSDATGNSNTAATQFTWSRDATSPTMAISSATVSSGATSNDSSIALTFTSNEVTTNFAEADITVTGGSLSSFAASSSTVYTATFTPSSDGATTVDVGAGAFTDSVGNNNSAASQFTWTYDSTAPTLATVTEVATPANDATPSFVFSSSESGILTTNVTEGFSSSSSVTSGNNTVTFNSLDDGTYSGKTITVTDAGGNSDSLTLADFVIETVSPTMTITSSTVSDGDTSNDSSIALTFTSNEATSNFVVGDVTVSGGVLSSFASSSSTVYTATFTPSDAAATSIDVAAGVFTDASGNGNTAASQFNWTFDNSSAELSNVSISSNNATSTLAKASEVITLVFSANETINTPTVTFASGGSAIASGRVSVSNTSGNDWAASYTTGSSDSDGAVTYSIAFSDQSGNAGAPVTSGSGSVTFDNTRPVSSISSAQVGNGGATNAGSIAVAFGLSDSTTEFNAADVSVSGGSLSDFSGSGTSYSATFTPNGDGTKTIQIVRAAYTDAAGNVSWATGEFSYTYDGTFPTINVSNMYSKIIDGMTDLGTATADEDVTWSISGTGVSISNTGTVTLDTAADHLVAESHTFTISAMDSVGNSRHATMTVEVGDVTAPTIDYSNLVHTIDEGKTALGYVTSTETVTWSVEGTGVSISSSGVVTLDSPASYADASYHSYRVTATDEEGIFRKGFLFTVFVNDTTAPVITLVGSATVDNELGYAYTDEGATAVDNKDGTMTSEITTVNSVDVDAEGSYTVTYDVTDAAGNAATQVVRTVTVTPDATIPVITLTGDSSVTVEGATSYSDAGASATDNIDGDLSSSITTVNNVDTKTPGTYTVTYNVSDAAGNAAAEVSRTVTVVDTTAPVITLSGGSSEVTTADSPFSTNNPVGNGPDGTLNTADDVVIADVYGVDGITFIRPATNSEAPQATWGAGTGRDLTRVGTNRYFRKFTWEKARDWCVSISGRLATGAEVTTHLEPKVGTGSDGTWETDLNWPQQTSHYWTGSVAGDDDGSETRHKAFITYNTGNGNSVHQVQGRANTNKFWPLCVIETESTTSEGSATVTHEQGTTYTDAGATALDSVDGVLTVVTTGSVDDSTAGTYVLTYTATDAASNSATKDRTVTVTDTISPVITLIGNAELTYEVGPTGTEYTDEGATATDGADGDLTSSIVVTGTVDLTTVGTYTLTYTLSDAAGNAATAVTRTITVTPDVTVPTITLLGDASQSYEMGTTYADAGATAADNIDGDITSQIVVTITNASGATLSSVDILTADTYTITYSVEDSTGNSAISVVRTVEITPDVTIPVIALLGESTVTLERYTEYVDAGATASDNIDGDITANISIVNGVDVSTVGTYVITYNVNDAGGNSAAEVTRTVVIVPIAISLSIPSDITVNATGYLTTVELGDATVSAGEGEISVSPSRTGPFKSGMYEITWTAVDSVGTTASAMQMLKVVPMVNLGSAVIATEGNTVHMPVTLSGHPADSSVTVGYSISGTATENEDYVSETDMTVTIDGTDLSAMISVEIVSDAIAESDETLTISLHSDSLSGAVLGSVTQQDVTITEQDLAPKVMMTASQGALNPLTTIAKNAGSVDVTVDASDANPGTSFTYTWGSAYNTLPGAVDSGNVLSFDPSTMDTGVVDIAVDVSDGANTTMSHLSINVIESMPVLSSSVDTDGDGVSDLDEGMGDDDRDGVPNYLDAISQSNVMTNNVSVAESEPGTLLMLGSVALGTGDYDISVSEAEAGASDTTDVGFDYVELSDFVISGAEPGHSYKVVIPLSTPTTETSTYRKYIDESLGWQMFVEDAANMIMSAKSASGVCPAAGSSAYGPGWYIGDDCLQLMIEDGGPNDADGIANGMLVDPSGVAEKFIGTPSTDSTVSLGSSSLNANGSDSTSITVTALDASGMPLEHMSVTGSIGLTGASVSSFYEQGSGVYTATLTAGSVSGTGPVTVQISNGQTSVTVYSEQLTLNNVSSTSDNTSSGGGGCTVGGERSSDNSLILLLLGALLLIARRRYYRNL